MTKKNKKYYGFNSLLGLENSDTTKLDLDLASSELQENTITTGIVIKVDDNFIHVDIGAKSEAKIPVSEFLNDKNIENDNSGLPQIGEKIEVFISKLEGKNGKLALSKTEALKSTIYDTIQKLYDNNLPVTGKIISLTKAGYVVLLMDYAYAFLPGSQLELGTIAKDPASYIGKTFEFKILNIITTQDNKKGGNNKNIIISRRAIFEETSKLDKAKAIQYLTVNQVIKGKIKNIMSYGAFVTIPIEIEEAKNVTENSIKDSESSIKDSIETVKRIFLLDGLVHVTDISWERIDHPSEKLNIGDEMNFIIKDIDPINLKVHLSIKLAQSNPWDEVEKQYAPGTKIIGKVTNISSNDSCAFLNIGNGIEGILPSSEIAWSKSVSPRQHYFIGQEIEVLITEVDKINQKITLSVKQLSENPWLVFADSYKIGDKLKLKVDSIKPYGAFLTLIDKEKKQLKIEGLLHVYDISWTEDGQEFLSKLVKGDEINCIINNIDAEKQKVSLGIKQLTEDPYKNIYEEYKVGNEIEIIIKGRKDDYIIAKTKENINVILPRSEIASILSERRFDRFAQGDTVKSIILSVDRNENRIIVSVSEYEKNAMQGTSSSNSLGNMIK
ncbi:MAG: S1 RNA-binding domain-containing protein [Rickettsiales bacterium]